VSAEAVRWCCARCEVSVGQLDGQATDLPPTWTRSDADGSTFCLVCSRALAGDAAMDSAPEASTREERFRLRRDAVIEFEIGRTPEAPNRAIANACHTSSSAVAAVRGTLEDGDASPDPDLGARSAV
jgi:hypothetical protein